MPKDPAQVRLRNNVRLYGSGAPTMVFAHGFGGNQSLWSLLLPAFEHRYRALLFDLAGHGDSDPSAYDPSRYQSLQVFADDLLEIIDGFCDGPVVFVGHSVGGIIGLLAANRAPDRFLANLLLCPSPCFVNDGTYYGGFLRRELEELLAPMHTDYEAWSHALAPMLLGVSGVTEQTTEVARGFLQTNQELARHFARLTFLHDHRNDAMDSTTPTLIVQSSDDTIVPRAVGEFLYMVMPQSKLHVIDNKGHFPHLSAPEACAAAMTQFLQTHGS